MTNDIVARLRRDCMSLIADEAADEIERLRELVRDADKLRDQFFWRDRAQQRDKIGNGTDTSEADNIALRRELDAWKANIEEPQEIDVADMEARLAVAKTQGKDSFRLSARQLWMMASDRRGREEE